MPTTVSAIISAFNAERFLAGRLDDLMSQTLFKQGRLEIIIVDAGSTDGTKRILREFLRTGLFTIITSLREPIYSSFNRSINMATGDYITNANCDDRLRPDALEVMADTLDSNPDIGLVYADAIVTDTVDAKWDGSYHVSKAPPYTSGKLSWPEFDPLLLTKFCYCGQSPLWRRSLHEQFGVFDPSYLLAGDYEWALRLVAHGVQFKHIPETLGLFYNGGAGISNPEQSAMESRRAILAWKRKIEATWAT